jgi:hypothetical protein
MSLSAPSATLQSSRSAGHTVPEAFDTVLKSLSIEASKSKASKQQQNLRENLASHLQVQAAILTGSYRRGTQIPPLDDIDVLLVLDREEYDEFYGNTKGQTTGIVNLTSTVLHKAYPLSEIRSYDRGVRISFTGTGIGFDVTPAFQLAEDVFTIPDRREGRWILTNPKEHQRQISAANQNVCGQWLMPLVKLLKLWNQEHGRRHLNGFHLEVMAFRALRHAPADARQGLAYLFEVLSTAVLDRTPDLWPHGLDVDEYLSSDARSRAAARLAEAAMLAREAVAAEKTRDADAAHWRWRQLLGDRYPEAGVKREPAKPVSAFAAASAVANGARVAATSAGLIVPTAGYASARSGTSHGGNWDPEFEDAEADVAECAEAERQIGEVLGQFTALRRIEPAVAVADPALWPVHGCDPGSLKAVLVGEQRTNLGGRHRILVAVPAGAPVTESRIYALAYPARQRHEGDGRFRPYVPIRHQWRSRALCTHAQHDRWDGRLVTLMIWAAEWLFRQDYYQRHGVWLGAEIARGGRRQVNALHGGHGRRRRV